MSHENPPNFLFSAGTDSSNSAYDITDVSAKDLLDVVIKMGLATTENGLQTEGVKKLVHAGSEVKFDIIIVEAFFQEAFLMFAHKFKCPVVAVSKY